MEYPKKSGTSSRVALLKIYNIKRLTNIAKHSIDFFDAVANFALPHLEVEATLTGSEVRRLAIGPPDDRVIIVVYTQRGGAVRLISARRPRRGERARSQALYHGGNPHSPVRRREPHRLEPPPPHDRSRTRSRHCHRPRLEGHPRGRVLARHPRHPLPQAAPLPAPRCRSRRLVPRPGPRLSNPHERRPPRLPGRRRQEQNAIT
jgi:uncharacterized DUF497 family protein